MRWTAALERAWAQGLILVVCAQKAVLGKQAAPWFSRETASKLPEGMAR